MCNASTCQGEVVPTSTPQAAVGLLTDLAQEIGVFNILVGILVLAVAWAGFKKGHRWAWYLTLWFFATTVADFGEIGNPIYLLGLILAGIGLLLSFGKFFPKKTLGMN